MLCSRLAQNRREYRREQRCDDKAIDGDFWLVVIENGGPLYTRRGPKAFSGRCDAPARSARTKRHRIRSHRRLRWDFSGKNMNNISTKIWEWCPWPDSN